MPTVLVELCNVKYVSPNVAIWQTGEVKGGFYLAMD